MQNFFQTLIMQYQIKSFNILQGINGFTFYRGLQNKMLNERLQENKVSMAKINYLDMEFPHLDEKPVVEMITEKLANNQEWKSFNEQKMQSLNLLFATAPVQNQQAVHVKQVLQHA